VRESSERVTVYGADSCGVSRAAMAHLDELGVPYAYVDIERDPEAAAWVRERNRGLEIKPTIDIGGEVLSAPADHVLDGALASHGLTG